MCWCLGASLGLRAVRMVRAQRPSSPVSLALLLQLRVQRLGGCLLKYTTALHVAMDSVVGYGAASVHRHSAEVVGGGYSLVHRRTPPHCRGSRQWAGVLLCGGGGGG